MGSPRGLALAWIGLAVCVLSLSPVPSAALAPDYAWGIAHVEAGVRLLGSIGFALDTEGNPHFAYADDALGRVRYAHWDDGRWSVVSPPRSGWASGTVSLALDQENRPYISYYDVQGGVVRFAHFTGSTWRVLEVDKGHYQGHHAIAVSPDGVPHVAYAWDNGDLRRAWLDGLTWNKETVDSDVVIARYPSIVFDSQGRPQIAYYGSGALQLAKWVGFRWRVEAAVSATPHFVSLVLNATDAQRIAYREETTEDLRYVSWNGTAWIGEIVDSEGDTGWDCDLALDSQGRPHVSYYDRTRGMLLYAVRMEDWETRIVDIEPVSGWYSGIAVSEDDHPRFAYYNWEEETVHYARAEDGPGLRTWPTRDVGTTSATLVGEVTSLGNASQVVVSFEWRTPDGDWRALDGGTLTAPGTVTANLGGLEPETEHEARVVVSVGAERHAGAPVNFTTLKVPTQPLLVPIVGGATILGITIIALMAYSMTVQRRKKEAARRRREKSKELGESGDRRVD